MNIGNLKDLKSTQINSIVMIKYSLNFMNLEWKKNLIYLEKFKPLF